MTSAVSHALPQCLIDAAWHIAALLTSLSAVSIEVSKWWQTRYMLCGPLCGLAGSQPGASGCGNTQVVQEKV
jgi:hypothetical protein